MDVGASVEQASARVQQSSPQPRARWLARIQSLPAPSGKLVALCVALTCAYFVPRGVSWNADTHLYLTASIADRGTFAIDPFAHLTGDVAASSGHFYADKAPGLSLAAVPVYLLFKYTLFHGAGLLTLVQAPEAARMDFLLRYLLAGVFAAVPTGVVAALLLKMFRRLGVGAWWSAALALIYGLATPARAFGGEFFSHQFAAMLVFGAYVTLYRVRLGERTARWATLAGLLLGWAVITEYPTALLAAILVVYGLLPRDGRGRRLGWLAAGATGPLLLCGWYNAVAFGSPLTLGYGHLAGPEVFRVGQAQGIFGVTLPHPEALWQTTFGPYRGMFLLSPVLVLAVPGFLLLWRRLEWRGEAALWLALVGVYGLFSVSYFAWDGGYSLGPRQFYPALPFLMLPLGELVRPGGARGWKIAVGVLGTVSFGIIELASAVDPLFDPRYASPLTQFVLPRLLGMTASPGQTLSDERLLSALARNLPLFRSAQLDNNWGMVVGLHGLPQVLPLALVLCGCYGWWWRASRRDTLRDWK